MGKDNRSTRRAAQNQQAKVRQLADMEHKAELTAAAAADLRAKLAEDGVPLDAPEAAPAGAPDSDKKDIWVESYVPYRPYGGVTTLKDALAAMDAEARAWAVQKAAWLFQDITGNILADENVTDKGKAIAAAAKEFQALLDDPEPLMKAKADDKTPPPDPQADTTPDPNAPAAKPPVPGVPMQPGGAISPQAFLGYLALLGAGAKEAPAGAMVVFKESADSYRWFGWVTNKWRDRDTAKHPKGEIITDAAHKEFVAFLDANPGQAPEHWTWHTPGSARKSRADWWDYVDGFLVMSGPHTPDEAKGFEADAGPIGMSHGFRVFARNAADGLIEKYRTFEVSDLPLDVAANPFTAFDSIRKELDAMPFSKEKRAYLVTRLGEERVAQLESNTGDMAKALEALGVESKETEAPAAPPPPASPAQPDQIGPADEVMAKAFEQLAGLLNVDELKAGILGLKAQADLVPTLQTELETLKAQVADMKKSDDEKVAETLRPRLKPIDWGFQASTAKSTELTADEKAKLGENKPTRTGAKGTGWVQEAMGVS